MVAAATAASSAPHVRWYWSYLRLLGSRNEIRLSTVGIHLILCFDLFRVF